MATRDYVGNSPRRRAGGRNIKKAAPRRFPVIPALLAGALVVGFGAFLYLINGKGADAPTIEEQVKANKPKAQGNTLPQEKWSYIERLENKQVDIIEPPPQPGVLPPPPAETMTLQPEKLPKPVATDIPQPGTPIGQVKPYQPQPVQPTKPATGAPVASAREQVIDQKAERERMEREIRAELERERAEAARAKAATQTAQTAAADGGRYMMQCAALRSQDSAESLKARIAFTAGLSSSLQVVNGAGGAVYKVMVGPFNGKAAADAANRKLQGSGISGCIPKKG
ncbi:SPOR domain-containing protein [Aeromonas caviae]|jgi:cell division protein FtsN|uniref:Cell division protein n=1 Tax=Aeromonas caviae TaxID=648 RepID=A0A443VW47_AERCA|nr:MULTISPECIES: SPOR domain-containing protein [Aeromonas]PZQ94836.1 MAG: cell division protein [Aeromonas media]AUU23031.1 cell division protein [Aeromonas caviae]KEP90287.1 cell division protein [Aeromonas caviae]KLV37299.1 cell division protein FtsN [Aeromonas caviae]KMY39737.1 cell division protein [Aeromonas caviae]